MIQPVLNESNLNSGSEIDIVNMLMQYLQNNPRISAVNAMQAEGYIIACAKEENGHIYCSSYQKKTGRESEERNGILK